MLRAFCSSPNGFRCLEAETRRCLREPKRLRKLDAALPRAYQVVLWLEEAGRRALLRPGEWVTFFLPWLAGFAGERELRWLEGRCELTLLLCADDP